jgi:hypothetical protein
MDEQPFSGHLIRVAELAGYGSVSTVAALLMSLARLSILRVAGRELAPYPD